MSAIAEPNGRPATPGAPPLVSVVTPVHNGEPYFVQCIESVLAQTYSNWQYLIVENCSTDRTLEIARTYAARDARIKIITTETFLSQLRNLNWSLSLVPPEARYVKMVFADDWIFPRCIEEMVAVAEAHPEVAFVSSYCLEEEEVTGTGLVYPSTVTSGREICRRSLLNWLFVFGSPNNLLYRADVLRARQPVFSETSLHCDTEACYQILAEHDLGFIHQVLTFTRRRNQSLTTAKRMFDPEHWLDRFIVTLKYAPVFLEPQESASRIAQVEADYYRFLGARGLYRTNHEFWEYHRRGLALAGHRLRRGKVASAIALAALQQLARPDIVARRVRNVLRKGLVGAKQAGSSVGHAIGVPPAPPAPSGAERDARERR